MRRSRTLISTLAFGLLLVGACGDDGDDSIPMTGNRPTTTAADEAAATEAGGFPVTVDVANGSVEIAERPEQIVSLSPTATEMLYAIGAGDQVEAVDSQSDYPADAPVTDLSGFEPNVEAISGYDPDLVLVADDTAIPELDALDIPVLDLPPATTLDDSYAQITVLGQATGHVSEATTVVDTMTSDITALIDQVTAAEAEAPISVYHEVDNTLYTITAASFIGQIYELAGLSNIAADLGDGQGYAQISAEEVIDANPDWIFLAYGSDPEIDALKARPGWDQITAVQQNQVVALDPDIASRWGPRSVDLLRTIVETTHPES